MSEIQRFEELNRQAKSQGMFIQKSPSTDPDSIEYGGYMLVDASTSGVVLGSTGFAFQADLDEIEEYLSE